MWDYELRLVDAIKADGTLGEKELKSMFVQMIKDLNNRMKGFSLKETREYHQSIVRQAWRWCAAPGPMPPA